MDLFPSIKIFQ